MAKTHVRCCELYSIQWTPCGIARPVTLMQNELSYAMHSLSIVFQSGLQRLLL